MTAPVPAFPEARAVFVVPIDDGAALPVYDIGGPAAAPIVLFGHANGFAAGSYGPWLARLARRLRVFAFDARGHGGARWPAGPLAQVFSVDRMAEDLVPLTAAVAAQAAVPHIAYVGHSLGAAAALRLEMNGRAPAWRALIAFEPPIFPPPGGAGHDQAEATQGPLIAGTAKRRARWPSPEAFCQRLAASSVFARFDGAMLRAHCRATLRPDGDGYVLRCSPDIESFIFESHWRARSWLRLAAVQRPVELIGGDPTLPDHEWISAALPAMAAALPDARLTIVPGTGHMLIAERPDLCADLVVARVIV